MRFSLPKLTACTALVVLSLAAANEARALGVKVGNDTTFANIGALLQTRLDVTEKGAPNARDSAVDLYVRRMRLILFGQLNDKINFFLDTDNPNFGKAGDFASNMFIQDAFLELNIDPMLQIDVGLLLLPFSHQGMTGATSLLLADYHASLMRYPATSNRVWRDTGIMLRGVAISKMLEYRLSVTSGVRGSATPVEKESEDGAVTWTERTDPRNNHGYPRVTARLALNLLEPEGGSGASGFFYKGAYLKSTDDGLISPKKVLTLGLSADWQKDLVVRWADVVPDEARKIATKRDYWAVAADLFVDMPLREDKLMAVTGQVDVYYYDFGKDPKPNANKPPLARFWPSGKKEYTGIGAALEVGVRYDAYGIGVGCDWFNAAGAVENEGDLLAVYGGPLWWFQGHDANLKLLVGGSKAGKTDPALEEWLFSGMLQAQLTF